jgi:anaerobic ribonucleoside-triphosphate reductase
MLVLLSLTAGCGEQQQATTHKEETKITTEDIKKEAKELVEATKSYTMEQKKAYEEELAKKLDEYGQKTGALKAQLMTMQGEAQKDMQEKIDSLHAKVEDMKSKALELQNSSDAAWDDLKAGLDKAEDDLEEAFTTAMQNFQK